MTLRQPSRPNAKHSAVVEDLIEMADKGHHAAVRAVIEMLEDLIEYGNESCFLAKLKGIPLYELKTAARGGEKGGTRVYLFFAGGEAHLCNAEVKSGDAPSLGKLKEALAFWQAAKAEMAQDDPKAAQAPEEEL